MDLQTYLDNYAKAERQKRLNKSDQLTLGQLIAKLEPIVARQPEIIEKYSQEAEVVFDFEYLFPTRFASWRGSYDELALNFSSREAGKKPLGVSEFLKMCKGTIGQTFWGYKGGDFMMGKATPIWIANYGNSGNTALIEVVDNEYQVILMTGWREY